MNSLYPDLLEKRLNPAIFWKKIEQIFKLLLVLSIPLTAVIWVLAPLLGIIKTDFANSIGYLRILALSLPIFYLTSPLMWYFVIVRKQQKLVIIYASSMLINLILNLFLIPKFGATGAASATCITEALVLIMGIIALRKIKYAA